MVRRRSYQIIQFVDDRVTIASVGGATAADFQKALQFVRLPYVVCIYCHKSTHTRRETAENERTSVICLCNLFHIKFR